MSNSNNMELVAKAMDLSTRTIDLLAVLGRLTEGTGTVALIARELGRWLGREGVEEDELRFFLAKTQALTMPNRDERVLRFFSAVTTTRRQSTVVPFSVQPFGSMGKYLASDPLQQWISSTICCLFRYHDQRYIKSFLSFFLILSAQKGGEVPPRQYKISSMPEKLRLDPVVSKVVESTWLHVGNAGLLGNDNECPRLPEEFDWACTEGHDLDEYQLAILLSKISRLSSREIIIQSKHILTNLVLWLSWHYAGRLRVVVSGRIVYDRVLGPEEGTVECRVAVFCAEEPKKCSFFERDRDEGDPRDHSIRVFESIAGSLHLLFKNDYSSFASPRGGVFVRQPLYEWPHRYPKQEKRIKNMTWVAARELLTWFLGLPVVKDHIPRFRCPSFSLELFSATKDNSHALKVGDLLGRSPSLLNMCSDQPKQQSVVFSAKDVEENDSTDPQKLWGSLDQKTEDLINDILVFFPILRDLVDDLAKLCECPYCFTERSFKRPSDESKHLRYDENCLAYMAVSEVMFYFSHGIADAFGAPDACGATSLGDNLRGDLGGWEILRNAITRRGSDTLTNISRGTIQWSTMFDTALRVFLGVSSQDLLRGQEKNSRGPWFVADTPSIVAVQYGSLAVIAPWLDISEPLSCRRSFRFEVVQGQLALDSGEVDGQHVFRRMAGDMCVFEAPRTEDVSEFNSRLPSEVYEAGAALSLEADKSEEQWDWILVPVNEVKKLLLLRVASEEHSRMIDPSNTLRQLYRSVEIPACAHPPAGKALVPRGTSVEVHGFGELLGRWGEPNYDTDTDNISDEGETVGSCSDEDSDFVSDAENSDMDMSGDRLGPSSSTSPPRKRLKLESPFLIRTSHVLDSAFKFNAAMALSSGIPLVASGQSCLECGIEHAKSIREAERARPSFSGEDEQYFVVNRVKSPAKTTPLALRGRPTVQAIESAEGLA